MFTRSFTLRQALLFLTLFGLAWPAAADKYDDARESFARQEATAPYFEQAYGYALFPTIGKGGIGVGGAYGEGRVYEQGRHIGDTSMSQLTIGLQLGGQAYSMIVFFEDARALREFTSGNFEFGAQASAVALTAGVSAEASTGGGATVTASGGRNDATSTQFGYRKGLAIFTVAKGGAMYEATLGGQKFKYKPLQ
jgi:lipid-binding SYLF domain-containing protein